MPKKFPQDPHAQLDLPGARFGAYLRHCIVYLVDEERLIVTVVRVWHAAREGFSPGE